MVIGLGSLQTCSDSYPKTILLSMVPSSDTKIIYCWVWLSRLDLVWMVSSFETLPDNSASVKHWTPDRVPSAPRIKYYKFSWLSCGDSVLTPPQLLRIWLKCKFSPISHDEMVGQNILRLEFKFFLPWGLGISIATNSKIVPIEKIFFQAFPESWCVPCNDILPFCVSFCITRYIR